MLERAQHNLPALRCDRECIQSDLDTHHICWNTIPAYAHIATCIQIILVAKGWLHSNWHKAGFYVQSHYISPFPVLFSTLFVNSQPNAITQQVLHSKQPPVARKFLGNGFLSFVLIIIITLLLHCLVGKTEEAESKDWFTSRCKTVRHVMPHHVAMQRCEHENVCAMLHSMTRCIATQEYNNILFIVWS